MGESNRTLLPVVWLGRVNRYPYPRIKNVKYGNLNQKNSKRDREKKKTRRERPERKKQEDKKVQGRRQKKTGEKDPEREKESPREREREAHLEWRKRAESGNWSEKDNERRWR
ncbi:hypothetical protein TNCV_301 [Trichonephila clavipes]|nr:hypothetical protein TNCV_301 [Trichonephila clavipes]